MFNGSLDSRVLSRTTSLLVCNSEAVSHVGNCTFNGNLESRALSRTTSLLIANFKLALERVC